MYFVEEWSSFGFVLMTFFCAGYVMRKNEFIRMENLVRRLSVTKRKVLELVLGLTAMFVISYFIQRSFSLFLMYWKSGAVSMFATKTPLWIPSMFIPLGLALFDLVMFGYWLQVLVDLVQSIKRQSASTS